MKVGQLLKILNEMDSEMDVVVKAQSSTGVVFTTVNDITPFTADEFEVIGKKHKAFNPVPAKMASDKTKVILSLSGAPKCSKVEL